jgi:hypothetical protein
MNGRVVRRLRGTQGRARRARACVVVLRRLLLLASIALGAMPALAAEVLLSPPGTDGWKPLEFPKIPKHTTYTVVRDGDTQAVKAVSDCAASALYMPVTDIDLARTPRLQWRWKVEQPLAVADERVKKGDDFAARAYVMFRFDPDRASLWQRLQHAIGTRLYGEVIPGGAINYVWASREARGAKWDNPFASTAKMVSLGSGPLPQWTTEVADVAEDYRDLFGHEPPPVLAVALMTDTDNSCQQAIAYYADFRFLSR